MLNEYSKKKIEKYIKSYIEDNNIIIHSELRAELTKTNIEIVLREVTGTLHYIKLPLERADLLKTTIADSRTHILISDEEFTYPVKDSFLYKEKGKLHTKTIRNLVKSVIKKAEVYWGQEVSIYKIGNYMGRNDCTVWFYIKPKHIVYKDSVDRLIKLPEEIVRFSVPYAYFSEIKYLSNMPESALETYINDDSLWNSLLTYPDVPNIKVEDIILPDTTIPPMDDEEEDDTIPSVPSTPIYPVPPTPIYPPSIDDNLPPVEGDDNESDGGETPDDGSVDDSENGDIPDTDGPDNDTTEEVTPPENQDTNGSEVEGGTLPDVSIDGTIKQQIREIVMSVLEEVL